VAIRQGPGPSWPGLRADLLFPHVVFPVCSPRLLEAGPPPRVPADLARFTLLHEDPWADSLGRLHDLTWGAWLAAVGAGEVDASRGLHFAQAHMSLQAALAGQGVALGQPFGMLPTMPGAGSVGPSTSRARPRSALSAAAIPPVEACRPSRGRPVSRGTCRSPSQAAAPARSTPEVPPVGYGRVEPSRREERHFGRPHLRWRPSDERPDGLPAPLRRPLRRLGRP
jgi:hypothetical protein